MLTLYQAEWCPYSARVRETMTELGVDFVAKQVAANMRQRREMRAEIHKITIPLLVLEDGTTLDDWQEMISYLREHFEPREDGDEHREKWFEEAPRRDPHFELT